MTERVTIVPEPTGPTAPPKPTAAPAIPEKFGGDVGKLATAYAELEKKLSESKSGKGLEAGDASKGAPQQGLVIADGKTPADPAAGDDGKDVDKSTDGADPADAAKKAVSKSGFDVTSFEAEFNASGDVSPDNRKKIAEGLKGVLGEHAETLVNQYIDGQKARAANNEAIVKSAVGGGEAYGVLVNWAKDALTPEEQRVFNSQVSSGNLFSAQLAVEGLQRRFERANGGRAPRTYKTAPTPPGGGGIQAYKSTAEMQADMRDPRYKTDPAFRDAVKARLGASNLINRK